jgi:sulfate/thiosulfate transport system ATP-binding protein
MSIVLEQVTKVYGNQRIVDSVSLEVAEKELFVLLGSSGSGKSTLLRMIAGLATPNGGRILLLGRDVTALAPQQRGTGFVFQNYSIFRHMTVAENIEFGLKIRKTPREERRRRREQLLDMVGLAGLGNRRANQLSGGQQQRVALARALIYEPSVLLLDEPFGALDVKIRSQLRRSLKEIQRRLGVTTILVTHDQEEAFELADRIGVLEKGRLLEVGAGENLYARPRSLFTATFLGAGTILVGRAREGRGQFGQLSLPIPSEVPHEEGARVQLLFRPEQVAISDEDDPPQDMPVVGKGSVIEETFAGAQRRIRLRLPRLHGARQLAPLVPFGEEGLLIDASLDSAVPVIGRDLWVALRGWTILRQPAPRLMVCDPGSGPLNSLIVAQLLTQQINASTTVLGVAENAEAAESLRRVVKERQDEAGLPGAELRIRFGNPADQIIREQVESVYDMLIMTATSLRSGRQGRSQRAKSRRRRQTLGTVLERAHSPVLIVNGDRPEIARVLICTAAGEPGKSDVKVGGQLARQLGATVTLLYVTRKAEEASSLSRDHLKRAAATLRAIDVPTEIRFQQADSPAAGILAEANQGQHDLIVIGSHGPRSRSLFGLNDVTLQVLSTADRSVLVVPAEENI